MARITQQSSIGTTGTSFENEPIVKSDGASSDVMEWAASTGSSAVKITEDSNNNLNLTVDGVSLSSVGAKIESITSSTTVGAVFVYDTRNDSDGGAWRKKCAGLSWFDETLNTATRGGRREFPSVALIVADNAASGGAYGTISVYDLDDPSMPLWRVFDNAVDNSLTSVCALNGRIYATASAGNAAGGLYYFDLIEDYFARQTDNTTAWGYYSPLAGGSAINNAGFFTSGLANNSVNDVAATVLEGAELGALGLPIPTVAVACGSGSSGGLSIIHPNGDVYDKATTSAAATLVEFDKDGNLYAGENNYINRFDLSTLYADNSTTYLSSHENNGTIVTIREFANASIPALLSTTTSLAVTDNGFAAGSAGGLTSVLFNDGDHEESAVAFVTSTYNSGYQLGDIRGAFLMRDRTADRSVKGNTLTLNQASGSDTVNGDFITNSETAYYSNFSASNYLSRANDTDFDFGTGDFSVMFWVKTSVASVGSGEAPDIENYICRMDNTLEAGDWVILKSADTTGAKLQFYRHNGSDWSHQVSSSATDFAANVWTQVVFSRKANDYQFYINGKKSGNKATNPNSYSPNSDFTIGHALGNSGPADSSSISLVRISATAPTPQQVKEMYEAEKPLFRSGAKCLLQGEFNSTIEGLAYDKTTGLLQATHAAGTTKASATIFRGLEVADTFLGNAHDSNWTFNSATLLAANGGVSAYYRNGGSLLCDLPPFDVRGDTNIADTKLPDDGKLHFSGVTPSSTFARIGMIPIAEGERLNVRAKVTGIKYGVADGDRINVTIENDFVRGYGGNIGEHAQAYKLTDESSSSMDVDLEANHASIGNHIAIKCTGLSGVRMVWHAEVEVVRSSDKQYER